MAVGRPREFDPDQVVEAALQLFWAHGFHGVSISDISAAAKVNRRGIYAEFGSKEKLYQRVVDRYLAGQGGYVAAALTLPTAAEVAKAAVHGAADTSSSGPQGCLTVDDGPGLAELREALVQRIARRFDAAVADGELAAVDTVVLARWIAAVCQGIAVQARSGASRDELHALADMALAGWPGSRAA